MRTTLTIDDDLAAILERERSRKGVTFKEMVNTIIRRGLASEQVIPAPHTIRTRPHRFGFKPGVDLDKLNQLSDELESEAFVRSYRAAEQP
jgi:hypothetical protein